jgi:hypothetical protein
MTEMKLLFEIEHLLNKALFGDPLIKAALASIGITREMGGNKRGLFKDAETVAALQALDDSDPLKAKLLSDESRLGINRHQGNAPGGNQFGKLRFLQNVYGDLVRRLGLPDGHADKISASAFKYAAYDALNLEFRGSSGDTILIRNWGEIIWPIFHLTNATMFAICSTI